MKKLLKISFSLAMIVQGLLITLLGAQMANSTDRYLDIGFGNAVFFSDIDLLNFSWLADCKYVYTSSKEGLSDVVVDIFRCGMHPWIWIGSLLLGLIGIIWLVALIRKKKS